MSELHENKVLFRQVVSATAQAQNIDRLFVEKDYWITRSLALLSRSQYRDNMVFKGGTSLSKAYGLTHRFSEDIDVAVINANQFSQNQLKRLIHRAAHVMSGGLEEVVGDPITRKTQAYYKQLYIFPTSMSLSGTLPIREGQILLEINSFGNPYPYVEKKLQSFIAEFLQTQEQFHHLIEEYGLQPFTINVLDKRRTLLEKTVSLLRFSFAKDSDELASKIRHFYDLYFLVQDEECQQYLQSDQFRTEFAELYAHDQESFDHPEGWNKQPHTVSPLLTDFGGVWQNLRSIYETKIPPLAYIKPIPAADKAAEAFEQIAEAMVKG